MSTGGLTVKSLVLSVLAVLGVACVLAFSVTFIIDGRSQLSRRRTALQLAVCTMDQITVPGNTLQNGTSESSISSRGEEYRIRTTVTHISDSGTEVRVCVTSLHGERINLARRLYKQV